MLDASHRTMSKHVKRDTKYHALKITKSPYSNCSKIGMMTLNIANKKPPGVHISARRNELN